jgi:hypothetical protein
MDALSAQNIPVGDINVPGSYPPSSYYIRKAISYEAHVKLERPSVSRFIRKTIHRLLVVRRAVKEALRPWQS